MKKIPDTPLGNFLFYMDEFFKKLKEVSPNDYQLESCHDKFNEYKRYNAKKLAELFVEALTPMRQQLMDKDENFFLCEFKLTSLDLSSMGIDIGEYEHKLYDTIRDLWKNTLTLTTKNMIWKYLTCLMILGEKCKDSQTVIRI